MMTCRLPLATALAARHLLPTPQTAPPLSLALLALDPPAAGGVWTPEAAAERLQQALRRVLRRDDHHATTEAGELVLLLPGADTAAALSVLSRLRRSLAAEGLSLCGGLAQAGTTDTLDRLLGRATLALEEAQFLGGDVVRLSTVPAGGWN